MSNSLFSGETPQQFSENKDIQDAKKSQRNLYDQLKSESFDFVRWITDFNDFACNHKRFMYTFLSSDILQEQNDDTVSLIIQNLTTITNKVSKKESLDAGYKLKSADKRKQIINLPSEQYRLIMKLYDHCNLANVQRCAYKQTKEDIKNITDESFDIKFHSYEKDITSQLIGLVSIFTALSFVIFGGISVLDSLMSSIKTLPVLKVIFIGDLWLLCMVNLFMLFTKLICAICSKIINLKKLCIILNSIMGGILLLIIGFIWIKYGFWFLISTTVNM